MPEREYRDDVLAILQVNILTEESSKDDMARIERAADQINQLHKLFTHGAITKVRDMIDRLEETNQPQAN